MGIISYLKEEIRIIRERDPALKSNLEVFLYPGNGVVIGETAEIGDYVTLYQGVTLGGTGKEQGKRHPTI